LSIAGGPAAPALARPVGKSCPADVILSPFTGSGAGNVENSLTVEC
jgi:hypothetical protein